MNRIVWVFSLLLIGFTVQITDAQEALAETFTSDDGSLSFNYPTGWIVEDGGDSGISGASSQEAFDAIQNSLPIPSGEISIQVLVIPAALIAGVGNPGGLTPLDLLGMFTQNASESGTTVDTLEEVRGGNLPVAYAILSRVDEQGIGIAVGFGGGNFVLLSASAVPGGIDPYLPTLLAIAQSIVFDTSANAFVPALDVAGQSAPIAGTGNVIWTQEIAMPANWTSEGTPPFISAIAVGQDGMLFVSIGRSYFEDVAEVVVLTSNGVVQSSLGSSLVTDIDGLVVQDNNQAWAVSTDSGAEWMFNLSADPNSPEVIPLFGIRHGQVEVDTQGNLYAPFHSEQGDTYDIVVLDPTGHEMRRFTLPESYDAANADLATFALAPDGSLYLGKRWGYDGRLTVVGSDGNVLTDSFGASVLLDQSVTAIEVGADGSVFVAANDRDDVGTVYRFDSLGNLTGQFGSAELAVSGTAKSSFREISGLALMSDGSLVVADGWDVTRFTMP
ncbi:MAG: hypothetical protein IPO91_29525 [Chloroflexi bacterium]|nr:hypothetical protein [Chloroflexota bacterium]